MSALILAGTNDIIPVQKAADPLASFCRQPFRKQLPGDFFSAVGGQKEAGVTSRVNTLSSERAEIMEEAGPPS